MLSHQGIWVTPTTSGKELMWCIDLTSRIERDTHTHTHTNCKLYFAKIAFLLSLSSKAVSGLGGQLQGQQGSALGQTCNLSLISRILSHKRWWLGLFFLGGDPLFLIVWLQKMVSIEIAIREGSMKSATEPRNLRSAPLIAPSSSDVAKSLSCYKDLICLQFNSTSTWEMCKPFHAVAAPLTDCMASVTHRKQFHERSCNKSQTLNKDRTGRLQNPSIK